MSECSKLSQTFKFDLTHFCNQIGVLQQLLREPLWKSMNLSSRSQRGGGLDVWQMWLRLAEAGRREAQPQTPTETVTDWAEAGHAETLTSLSFHKDTHSYRRRRRPIKYRRMTRYCPGVSSPPHTHVSNIHTHISLIVYSLSLSLKLTKKCVTIMPKQAQISDYIVMELRTNRSSTEQFHSA